MIANPGKFQVIIIDEWKHDHVNEFFKIPSKKIKVASQVKHLGLNVDNKLSLEQHINHIFKSAVNQLNAPIRLTSFLGFQEWIVLVNNFVLSNFIYRTLVWMFRSTKSLAKIENLHKRTSRFMLDYYSSSYELYI